MGRMSKEKFQYARTLFEGETGKALIAHVEAIELELKISKEDEERIAKAAERMTENIAQLQMNFNNAREMVKDQTERADFLEQERQRLQGEVFTLNQQLYGDLEKTEFKLTLKENERLKSELAELREQTPKKVALPKGVAAALDSFKSERNDIDFIVKVLSLNMYDGATERLRVLKNYAYHNGFKLISALVNGYTVEQTKEDRLREGLEEVALKWWNEKQEHSTMIQTLSERIYAFVTKFNTEN